MVNNNNYYYPKDANFVGPGAEGRDQGENYERLFLLAGTQI